MTPALPEVLEKLERAGITEPLTAQPFEFDTGPGGFDQWCVCTPTGNLTGCDMERVDAIAFAAAVNFLREHGDRLRDMEVAVAQAVEFAEYVERQAKGAMVEAAKRFLSVPYAEELRRRLEHQPALLRDAGDGRKSPFGPCVCLGANECPGCNPNEAIAMAREIATAEERRRHPPCDECGAMTAAEAETMCHCSGDKDDCHGCKLWGDTAMHAPGGAGGGV